MKMRNLFLISVLTFTLLTSINNAQFRMAVGSEVGFNFNLHTGSDLDEGGSGLGVALSGIVDMSFTSNRAIGLLTGLAFYDNRSGSSSSLFSQDGTNYSVDNDVSIAYFQIISLFKYRIPNVGVYFVFGPQIGFDLSSELEQTYSVVGGQTVQKTKNSLKDTNTRFELKLGGGWDIELSPLITLAPQLTFGLGLTNVIEDVDYSIHTIQLSVTCKFNVIN